VPVRARAYKCAKRNEHSEEAIEELASSAVLDPFSKNMIFLR